MYVPQDILIEILSRVPAKSLVRFRCVSNWFNCLTCDVQFQNKHLKVSCSTRDLVESKRVVTEVDDVVVSFSLSSVYNNAITWRPIEREIRSIPMAVHCPPVNGLVCVTLRSFHWLNIHLWNPTTNELRRLANSSLYHSSEEPYDVEGVYGLGHDSANDDYVVVRLIMRWSPAYSMWVEVYSLKNDSWRLIQPIPYTYISRYKHCQFVNSRFHWMIFDAYRDEYFSHVIVSLNLSNYQYEEIPQPNYQNISADSTDIAVLDGQLCVCIHYFGRSFDLWTMREYGVQKSWMMMLSITQHDILDRRQLHGYGKFFPLYLFENGDVLLQVSTGDYLKTHDIMVYKKDKKVFGASSNLGHEALYIKPSYIYYSETLISPNRYLTPAALRIVKNLNRVSRDRLFHYVS